MSGKVADMSKNLDFQLSRNAFGRLVLTDAEGLVHDGVTPVRAFPLAAPNAGLSLVGPDGHELAWIDQMADLPADLRDLIEDDLATREFTPVIEHIKSVSTFSTPSTWEVSTDRGETQFVLKGEEDIRRLPEGALLIMTSQGGQFLIRKRLELDRASRRILERFL